MRRFVIAGLLLATATAMPAFAQDGPKEFGGFYVGGSLGITFNRQSDNEIIQFDRNLDGAFGDTVTTSTGANAFAATTAVPGAGFCSGSARGSSTRPAEGCDQGSNELEFSGRVGWDHQTGNAVFGFIAEIGTTNYSSSVSAFSVTPASYTFTREIDYLANLRARIGYAIHGRSLVYFSAGIVYAKMDRSFTTTNTTNSVTVRNTDDDAWGSILALGFEQKLNRMFSVGLEGTLQNINDNGFRARLGNNGTTASTNPFLLGNPGGTDFRRSDEDFDIFSLRAVLNIRL